MSPQVHCSNIGTIFTYPENGLCLSTYKMWTKHFKPLYNLQDNLLPTNYPHSHLDKKICLRKSLLVLSACLHTLMFFHFILLSLPTLHGSSKVWSCETRIERSLNTPPNCLSSRSHGMTNVFCSCALSLTCYLDPWSTAINVQGCLETLR